MNNDLIARIDVIYKGRAYSIDIFKKDIYDKFLEAHGAQTLIPLPNLPADEAPRNIRPGSGLISSNSGPSNDEVYQAFLKSIDAA